jgi:Tfp pilus assembly protein PilV
VTAAFPIDRPIDRASGLPAKVRDEDGIGLVEMLIALLVLNIGIFATLAAFTSGALALRRASHTSTAAAIADKQMEAYRDSSYSTSIPPVAPATSATWGPTNVTGADGLTYKVYGSATTGSQLTTGAYPGSANVKVVTITVRGPGTSTTVLDTSTSTFSLCSQSGLGTEANPCRS